MVKIELNENFDFIKTCRLCLNQNNELVSVFGTSSLELQYLMIINECTEAMISENDELPKNICLECVECLNKFYLFRKLVVKSEIYLNKFWKNLSKDVKLENTNNIKEENYLNEESTCSRVKNEEDLLGLEEIKIKMEIVEENLENCKNETLIEPTQVANSHIPALDHNSFFTTTKALNLQHLKESKEISTSSQLVKRKTLNNKSEKRYSCQQCGKSFSRPSHLNKHKRIHTGDKPLKCKLCEKSFNDSSNLRVHETLHKGEKPYTCMQCKKSFTQLGHLNMHEKIHTGDKPYSCDLCGKSFSRSSYLNTHKRIHSGDRLYKCKLCEKSFINSSNLKVHEILHTGEKPYNCDICGKSFTQLGYLKIHEKIHTGKKSYNCKKCGKSFTRAFDLKRHDKTHTGETPHKCTQYEKSKFC